jgi:hypothetical protein
MGRTGTIILNKIIYTHMNKYGMLSLIYKDLDLIKRYESRRATIWGKRNTSRRGTREVAGVRGK